MDFTVLTLPTPPGRWRLHPTGPSIARQPQHCPRHQTRRHRRPLHHLPCRRPHPAACTPPGRPLRASLNTARVTRPAATADPSTTSPAAAHTPPARALRVSLNPACVSRPSAAAAAKKPKRPELSGDENPTTKRPSVAGDGKGNKNALAGASKVGTVLLPCSRVDEARRLALANTTTRHRGAAAADHAGASTAPAPALKRKVAPEDSEIAVHWPCSRGDEASRSLLDNSARLRVAVADGHAGAIVAPAPVTKWKARPAGSEIAMRRPCSRGDGASRLPLGNTARLRVGAAAEGHVAPASAAKRKAAPSDSVPAKRRATPAPASAARASPSPPSSDSGATVRELLEKARTATDAIRRRELERLKAASRRELDRVVRTVEFNDPFISPQDVLR